MGVYVECVRVNECIEELVTRSRCNQMSRTIRRRASSQRLHASIDKVTSAIRKGAKTYVAGLRRFTSGPEMLPGEEESILAKWMPCNLRDANWKLGALGKLQAVCFV